MLEIKALLKLNDLSLLPDWVLFELTHEDLILFTVLSEASLCFFGTLAPVTDDNTRDAVKFELALALSRVGGILISTELLRVFQFHGHLQSSRMLVKGCFGLFLEESVNALIEVIAEHVVVDDTQFVVEYSAFLAIDHTVGDLGQLTLLLDNFDRLAAWSAL